MLPWLGASADTVCNKEFSWPLERLRLPSEDILIESVARRTLPNKKKKKMKQAKPQQQKKKK